MTLPHGFIFVLILYLIGAILPKLQAPKRHKKGRMAGCVETELSTEGFFNFLDTTTMFYVLYNRKYDDCYVFSSSNHQLEKYVPVHIVHMSLFILPVHSVHIMMILV